MNPAKCNKLRDRRGIRPGLMEFSGSLFVSFASCNRVKNEPICEAFHSREPAQLADLWLEHSNQSATDFCFFPFIAQRISCTPYKVESDKFGEYQIKLIDIGKLNLILNARFIKTTRRFLMKKPIHLREVFRFPQDPDYNLYNRKIQKALNYLVIGYIKEFEQDNNMNIPAVIVGLIKSKIKVAPSIFHCLGFKNPLFGVYDKNTTITPDFRDHDLHHIVYYH